MAKICINNNHIRWRTCVANSDERIVRIGENKKEKENNNNSIVSIRVLNLLVDFTRESLVPSDCNRNSVSFWYSKNATHASEKPKGGSTLCLDHQACLSCRVEMVIEVVCFPTEILWRARRGGSPPPRCFLCDPICIALPPSQYEIENKICSFEWTSVTRRITG